MSFLFLFTISCACGQSPSELPPMPPSAPPSSPRVENAYNTARYIEIARAQFGLEIERIFLGHNKTGLTATIVRIPSAYSEEELSELQMLLNLVFSEYRSATLYTIVNYDDRPYALMMARTDPYVEEKNTVSVYFYAAAMNRLQQKAQTFVDNFTTYTALEGHTLVSLYYGLEWSGLPVDKTQFPKNLTAFTKGETGTYYSFRIYEDSIGDLWPYRFDAAANEYYSTGNRSDHQINTILPNGDMVNLHLHYFDADAERYGSYFLKIR